MIITRYGKQIHAEGIPLADAVDEAAAQVIVEAFAERESIAAYIDEEGRNKGRTRYVRQLLRAIAGNVRARLDVHQVAPEGERATYNDAPAEAEIEYAPTAQEIR